MNMIGEKIHRRLLSEGGFCWDGYDGDVRRITVHFNRGRKPSLELVRLLRDNAEDLKAYVIEENDRVQQMMAKAKRRKLQLLAHPHVQVLLSLLIPCIAFGEVGV